MGAMNQISHMDLVALLAGASSRMHASTDLPFIVREAVSTAIKLVGADGAAAGLFLNQKVIFSEYSDGAERHPFQAQFDAESWLAELIAHHKQVVLEKAEVQACFSADSGPVLAGLERIIAVPVLGRGNDLLACLLLLNPGHGKDVRRDLEQFALMMSSAIENSIRCAESCRAEADLEKSVATYRTLVEQIPAITYIATLDRSQAIFVSPQVEEMLGYSQSDILADQGIWLQQIHPDDRERVLAEIRQSVYGGSPFHSEYQIATKNGDYIWVKDAADIVKERGEELYLQGVMYDISERKETEQEMIRLAHFDQLTGLANRALFLDRLNQSIAQAKRHKQQFAVLFLDLDGFKAVNDNLGHKEGDMLLKEVAKRLDAQVREMDTVARMGGDEFTIILNEVSAKEDIRKIANKLIKAISLPYEEIAPEYTVTMSMGVSLYPSDSTNSDELITLADNAMYDAKRNGKNGFCFISEREPA